MYKPELFTDIIKTWGAWHYNLSCFNFNFDLKSEKSIEKSLKFVIVNLPKTSNKRETSINGLKVIGEKSVYFTHPVIAIYNLYFIIAF